MADVEETTTTTTTVEGETTTTTTTTVEKQGEQVIDKDADAHVLKEQSADERLKQARQEALDNHATEHANDGESFDSVTSRDKVEE